ncbi:MAG: hypothetical protein K6A98_03265 [Prevotella sp.]|nr:hypothetical protein [Prevotella sp.]
MKKVYVSPVIKTVNACEVELLQGSNRTVKNVTSNAGITYGGGGSGPARSRDNSFWEEDDFADAALESRGSSAWDD